MLVEPKVLAALQRLEAIRRSFTEMIRLDVQVPSVCVSEITPKTRLPVYPVESRFEPQHRPGMILHAYQHNGFRTFPDVATIDDIGDGDVWNNWELLENARTAKVTVTEQGVLEWLGKNDIFPKNAFTREDYDEIYRLVLQPKKLSALFVVDEYDWSWHILVKNLFRYWPEVCGDVTDIGMFHDFDSSAFDVVFVFPWALKTLFDVLDPEKTVVFLGGGMEDWSYDAIASITNRFHRFVALNELLRSFMKNMYPHCDVELLVDGVDTEMFKPRPIEHEDFTIGWVGSTGRSLKRFDIAQEIARRVQAKLNVAPYIDKRPHELMPRFYNECDMLLVTSEIEAHPLPVYEAMASGIPVLSTCVGDVDQVVTTSINGDLLDNPIDIDEAVNIVNYWKWNAEYCQELGRQARKTIERDWSWEKRVVAFKSYAERFVK